MEHRIREQLDRELDITPGPPIGSIVDDAVRVGTRVRRRRWFAVLGSAMSVLAITVVAGALAFGSGGGGPAVSVVIPAGPGTPTGKVQPDPTLTPATPPAIPPGHKATSGQAVVALLRELTGAGSANTEVDFSGTGEVVHGSFVYDDGHGQATVSAGVARQPIPYGGGSSGLTCPPSGNGFVCENGTTPDGFETRILTLGPYADNCTELKCSIKNVRVEVARPNGLFVVLDAFNGPFGQGRAATRADTILDAAALAAIALDPRWGLSMDAAFVDEAERTVTAS